MRGAPTLSVSTLLIALASTVHAAIEVTFVEDAPKDRFVIANKGDCTVEDLTVVIDLAPSAKHWFVTWLDWKRSTRAR